MTATSWGDKNEPKFGDGDAPDLALNPTQAAAYAAKVGNRRTGTTAERLAATGKDVWEGLAWGDTTNGFEYKRVAGSWIRQYAPTIRGGMVTATTTQGGDIVITFATPFTSACASIVFQDANTGAGIGPVPIKMLSKSSTGAIARVMSGTSGVAAFPTTIGYIAFGD